MPAEGTQTAEEEAAALPAGPGEEAPLPSPGPVWLSRQIGCSEAEFQLLRDFLRRAAGIALPEHKRALLEGRLAKRLRLLSLPSYRHYYRYLLEKDPEGGELSEFVNALTTNKTEFFREEAHFDLFSKELLPERMAARRRRGQRELRFWSAACSSGEEPYSLAMALREALAAEDPAGAWDAKILATDISSKVLGSARQGRYSLERLEGIPPALRRRHLLPHHPGGRGALLYEVSPEVRRLVTFRRFNLMEAEYPFQRPFDVVFCRNVMIYFDQAGREQVVAGIARALAPGGYLIIGHAESLLGLSHSLAPVGPTLYQKRSAG